MMEHLKRALQQTPGVIYSLRKVKKIKLDVKQVVGNELQSSLNESRMSTLLKSVFLDPMIANENLSESNTQSFIKDSVLSSDEIQPVLHDPTLLNDSHNKYFPNISAKNSVLQNKDQPVLPELPLANSTHSKSLENICVKNDSQKKNVTVLPEPTLTNTIHSKSYENTFVKKNVSKDKYKHILANDNNSKSFVNTLVKNTVSQSKDEHTLLESILPNGSYNKSFVPSIITNSIISLQESEIVSPENETVLRKITSANDSCSNSFQQTSIKNFVTSPNKNLDARSNDVNTSASTTFAHSSLTTKNEQLNRDGTLCCSESYPMSESSLELPSSITLVSACDQLENTRSILELTNVTKTGITMNPMKSMNLSELEGPDHKEDSLCSMNPNKVLLKGQNEVIMTSLAESQDHSKLINMDKLSDLIKIVSNSTKTSLVEHSDSQVSLEPHNSIKTNSGLSTLPEKIHSIAELKPRDKECSSELPFPTDEVNLMKHTITTESIRKELPHLSKVVSNIETMALPDTSNKMDSVNLLEVVNHTGLSTVSEKSKHVETITLPETMSQNVKVSILPETSHHKELSILPDIASHVKTSTLLETLNQSKISALQKTSNYVEVADTIMSKCTEEENRPKLKLVNIDSPLRVSKLSEVSNIEVKKLGAQSILTNLTDEVDMPTLTNETRPVILRKNAKLSEELKDRQVVNLNRLAHVTEAVYTSKVVNSIETADSEGKLLNEVQPLSLVEEACSPNFNITLQPSSIPEEESKMNTSQISNEINDDNQSNLEQGILTLSELKNILEETSTGKNCRWKLETLDEDEAKFKLKWGPWIFKCYLLLHVTRRSESESLVTLEKIKTEKDAICNLGYDVFEYFIKEKSLPFPVCSRDIVLKMAEYSSIALKAELLMQDLVHLKIPPYCAKFYDCLEPLKVKISILNRRRKASYRLICSVDLHSYPYENIVPEIKIKYPTAISQDEIRNTISHVEPGPNYLWNLAKAAYTV